MLTATAMAPHHAFAQQTPGHHVGHAIAQANVFQQVLDQFQPVLGEHRLREGRAVREVESLYAHLDAIEVVVGARLGRGQRLGTIGTAGGHYGPHLHFELRTQAGLPLGGGYGEPLGQVDPSAFIRAHRGPERSEGPR